MAFFKNIKKSLGFSNEEDFEIDEGVEAMVTNKNTNSIPMADNTMESNISLNDSKQRLESTIKDMQLGIFDSVVKIFNESLPNFLRSTVDENSQRQYIYDSLDQSIKDYLKNIETEIKQTCELNWTQERVKLHSEISILKSQCKDLESSKEEYKRQQLSAERQKRALSARLHDLEVQVTSLEAEKEQYDLENKSLVNKLKVSSIKDNDVDALREEITNLQAALNKARNANNGECDINSIIDEKDKELNKLNDTIQLLRTENESLNTSIEQLKVKEQLSDEIINNLNKKASQALKDLEEKDRFYQEKAKDSLTELAELEDLKNQIKEKTDRIVALSAELEEVQSGLQMIDQIQSEMEKFESIKKKKDAKITELQEELQYHKNRVLELESDTESLKNTIENNLYNQAIAEDLLKNEIKQLKATIEEHVGIKNTKKRETKQSQKVRISAIDESLDDADWLISTPPSGTPTRPIPATTENDFGYQAPPKKSTPENEAQMSLW